MIDTIQSSAILDPSVLADIRALSGPGENLLADLSDIFLSHAQEQLASLTQAIGARDADAIWQTAHRLKGSALGIGAWRFAKLCGTVEFAARSEALERAAAHANGLAAEFASASIALHQAVGA